MEKRKVTIKVFGHECEAMLLRYSKEYGGVWKELFDKWKMLYTAMHVNESRAPNLPEGLSEAAFCLYSGSEKLISLSGRASSSFDTYNFQNQRAEQVKATISQRDLSSFGPRSEWDDIYFLDFYNDGKLDGIFDIYKIPTELIKSTKVNKDETFVDQQKQKRRPRFSIKEKIISYQTLRPIARNVKVWEY